MSAQLGYPRITLLWRGIPTQVLWVTNPQPNCGQCYPVSCRTDSDGVRWWKFPVLSLNFLHLSRPGPPRLADNLQSTLLKTDLWINSRLKYPLKTWVSVDDLSGNRTGPALSPADVESYQKWTSWFWPCPAPSVLLPTPWSAFRGWGLLWGVWTTWRIPVQALRKTLGLSVVDLLPLSTFYSLHRYVCVFMSSLNYIWCIGTGRQHPV